MYGIKFDEVHSFDDLGLILSSVDLGTPEPKTMIVDINGANGQIDLTEALTGYTQYKNRKLEFTFQVFAGAKDWIKTYNKLLSDVHGKMMKVVMDEDPDYFYQGRVTVNQWTSKKTLNTIVVDVDADPFKYMLKSSEEKWLWDSFSFVDGIIFQTDYTVSGSLDVRVPNLQMVVCPVFECSSQMKVTFNGNTYDLPSGRSQVYEVMLEDGVNNLTLIGDGTVNIIYRGGTM